MWILCADDATYVQNVTLYFVILIPPEKLEAGIAH
jgi:hypothetical protein